MHLLLTMDQRMIVGAPYSGSYKGDANVYEMNQTNWELTAKLTAGWLQLRLFWVECGSF
jgi:hypothetical protein